MSKSIVDMSYLKIGLMVLIPTILYVAWSFNNDDVGAEAKGSQAVAESRKPGLSINPFSALNCQASGVAQPDLPQCNQGVVKSAALAPAHDEIPVENQQRRNAEVVLLGKNMQECIVSKDSMDYFLNMNEHRKNDEVWIAERRKYLDTYKAKCPELLDANKARDVTTQVIAAAKQGYEPAQVFLAHKQMFEIFKVLKQTNHTGQEYELAAVNESKAIKSLQDLAMRGNLSAINELGKIINVTTPYDDVAGMAYRIIGSAQDWVHPIRFDSNLPQISRLSEQQRLELVVKTNEIFNQCCLGKSKKNDEGEQN